MDSKQRAGEAQSQAEWISAKFKAHSVSVFLRKTRINACGKKVQKYLYKIELLLRKDFG